MGKIKTRALLYSKGPKVKSYQGGGYFNSGFYAPEEKDLFPGIQKPSNLNRPNTAGFNSRNYFSDASKNLQGFKPDLSTRPLTQPVKPVGYHLNRAADTAVKLPPVLKTPELATKPPTDFVAAGKSARLQNAGNVAEAVAPLAGIAGQALDNTTDNDDRTYTKKEKAGDIAGTALKTAATAAGTATTAASALGAGAATALGIAGTSMTIGQAVIPIPLVGAAIGFVIGGIIGLVKSGKAKRKAKKAQKAYSIKVAGQLNAKNRKANTVRDSELSQSLSTTGAAVPEVTGYSKEGGTFHWTLPKNTNLVTKKAPTVKKFKRGGKVKETENIIPNGVLHEEKNSLGDKGMPVVKCKNNSCSKQYEIERDEMILTLKTTKEIERLAKGKKFSELGEFIKKQVLQNTHSFTNKFVDLNNYKGTHETIYS